MLQDKIRECENQIAPIIAKIDKNCLEISEELLNIFHKNNVSTSHFDSTTGYGYGDQGREVIEKVYAELFKAEDALVRTQFISGSHALTVALFSILRPNDILLSITGTPYDTLHEVIGIKDNPSSLKSFNINYEQIDLINNEFDTEKIFTCLKNKSIKMIEIQRSKGYSTRKTISIEQIAKIIKEIRQVDQNVIIMIDNCYCEFVEKTSPIEVGADIVVGSLIKNLGGGIATNGAYIVGKKDLVALAAERLNLPGEGKEVGPTLNMNRQIIQGLFMAPSVVASSLKTAVFTSYLLEKLGYEVEPKYNEYRSDIVQNIIFHNREDLIKYVQGIQLASPIDSNALPLPWDMPGYADQVIMASGSFTQGSSIELSADGPIRPPYIAYQQGSLTYEYGKLGVIKAIEYLLEDKDK